MIIIHLYMHEVYLMNITVPLVLALIVLQAHTQEKGELHLLQVHRFLQSTSASIDKLGLVQRHLDHVPVIFLGVQ